MGTKLFLKNSSGQFLKNSSGQFIYKALPSTYQEVEYIQTTGTQRIKLSITPTSNYKIEEKFAITDRSVTSCIWCARGNSTSANSTTAFNIANSQIRCDYGVNATMTSIGAATVNQIYTLTMAANKWYLDGELKTTMTAANFTAGSALQLFASHYSGQDSNVGNYAKLKCYYFKVWDNSDNLICYLIPCYRKSDSVIGMYDLVNNQFYTNAGSGTFTKGSDISIPAESASLISFTVSSTTYQAEEGMTWYEWVNSEYNRYNYFINGSRICLDSLYINGQTPNDTLINNYDYFLTEAGGLLIG